MEKIESEPPYWQRSGNGSITIVTAANGSRAARFRIEKNQAYRSEVRLMKPEGFPRLTPYVFHVSYLVPSSYLPSKYPDVVAQLYTTADRVFGERGHSPPVSLRIADDRWLIEIIWDARQVTPADGGKSQRYQGVRRYDLGPVVKDKWVRFSMRVVMSVDERGMVDVWRDDSKKLSYRGPNTFNDLRNAYLKVGMYSPYWNSRGSYYHPDTAHHERAIVVGDVSVQQGMSCMDESFRDGAK